MIEADYLVAKKVRIFDPAMCCSSGVCGPGPDGSLVRFAADVSWLSGQGIEVERFNLTDSPDAFVAEPLIKEVLDSKGVGSLPVIIVDQEIRWVNQYPERSALAEAFGLTS